MIAPASSYPIGYIELLEKTNQQLGLWTNPYGVIVGALAVLFTALAIAFTFVLFRQSNEYKKAQEEERTVRQKAMNEFLEKYERELNERKTQAERARAEFDELIKLYTERLKNTEATGAKKIQDAIDRLKIERAKVEGAIGSATIPSNVIFGLNSSSNVSLANNTFGIESALTIGKTCKYCGHELPGSNLSIAGVSLGTNLVACPKCGHIQYGV